MATTYPTRIGNIASRPLPVRLIDKYFYFFMSLLVAVTVIYGFSQTINDNLFHPALPRPTLLYFHAICFSGWVAFFVFQSALVRTRNVRIHRLTGWFGAALGAAMVVLGYTIAVVMARFHLHTLHQADAVPFLIVPFFDITNFAVLFSLAILWRRKPELHRRLILLATCALTSAAFGRFPLNFPPPLSSYYGVDALMLLGVARDLIVNRRIHKVYLYTMPVLAACQWVVVYVFTHAPAWWVRIAQKIIG
jgi:hypothetical protein